MVTLGEKVYRENNLGVKTGNEANHLSLAVMPFRSTSDKKKGRERLGRRTGWLPQTINLARHHHLHA